MTGNGNEKIRPRVWLAGLAPIVVVALGVAAYLSMAGKKPAERHAVATADEVETAAPAAVPAPPAPQPSPWTPPSAPAAVPTAPLPSPSTSADAFREIDALLARPPNSGDWTLEQKNAYRSKLANDLLVRERSLEREVAAAHRARDTATEQTKTATLDYLRRRREALEAQVRGTPDATPSPDAGP
ncbi:MAG TPA: hypothetical protein VGL81_07470 [Polyangiaceae bacterium]|jgi:hypothetical protein